jgi:hypothetical protein
MKRKISLAVFMILVMISGEVAGHEIVGEVTPLMIRMQRMLMLIDNGLGNEAMKLSSSTYNDFLDPMTGKEEQGLKQNSARVDSRFGTDVESMISFALDWKYTVELKKGLRLLSFLLMLEKFNILEDTFGIANSKISAQRTIFWLGRNYFSYLLEPVLAKENPVKEKRLDRHLDKMLYRIEDGEWDEFKLLREKLTSDISEYFEMSQYIKLNKPLDN